MNGWEKSQIFACLYTSAVNGLYCHVVSPWSTICFVSSLEHLLFQNLAALWFSAFYRETPFCLYVNTEVCARYYDLTGCSYLVLCTERRIVDGRYLRTTLCKALVPWMVSLVWLACGTQLFLGNFLEHFFCGLHWSKSRSDWPSARQVFFLPEGTLFCSS